MVRTSFENSLKIRQLLDIREKSLNVFESSLNKNNLRLKKKTCFAQRNDWKHSNTQIFLGEHEKSFLMISVFLAWFIFRYLTYPFNRSLLKEGFAISDPPPPPVHFKSLYFMLLKSPWKVLDFFPKKFCMNHTWWCNILWFLATQHQGCPIMNSGRMLARN